jgi:hypothetical protein
MQKRLSNATTAVRATRLVTFIPFSPHATA